MKLAVVGARIDEGGRTRVDLTHEHWTYGSAGLGCLPLGCLNFLLGPLSLWTFITVTVIPLRCPSVHETDCPRHVTRAQSAEYGRRVAGWSHV